MSIDLIILSDEEEEGDRRTPLQLLSKKPTRWGPGPDPFPTVLVLDDDPTPRKSSASSSTPSFVAETPMSDFSVAKCTMERPSNPKVRVSDPDEFAESGGSLCLELENDDLKGGSGRGNSQEGNTSASGGDEDESWRSSRFKGSMDSVGDGILMQMPGETFSHLKFSGDHVSEVHGNCDKDNSSTEQMGNKVNQNIPKVGCNKLKSADEVVRKKKMTKEERNRIAEEKKLKKEQEKLQKVALKAQAAELKKMEKEKQKWQKGKFAVKSIVAEIDTKVVEQGSVGGHLLTRFAEKGLTYRITSNPIERSIVWTMNVPKSVSQFSSEGIKVQYVLLVYEAEEFCNLVTNNALLDHVANVRSCYPFYTLCYLTNRLMAYISKREKEQYKNPEKDTGWRCPPIEEVLAKLTTLYFGVHYRQCRDESELAEHVVDLTCSLASCQFRKKLTRLSVNANGSLIPKDSVDKNLIKKSPWLKALVAIPKVQPRFAIAIWKKYPTMKSLLRVYMDPSKSKWDLLRICLAADQFRFYVRVVHEKEFLLEHLATEGLLGADRRVGKICSKRIYRMLMAQSGGIKTDDVEDGADFFRHQSF